MAPGRWQPHAPRRIIGRIVETPGVRPVRVVLILLTLLLWWLPVAGFSDEDPLDVEDILSADPEAEDYVDSVRCLPVRRIRSATALDDRHIVFRVSRSEQYLVQLARRCPGLRRNDTLVYETTGGMSVCRNDSVRGTYGFGPGSRQLGPRCRIPEFQRITTEQLDLLRETLKQVKSR